MSSPQPYSIASHSYQEGGGPHYWQYEITGQLAQAVAAFFQQQALTDRQFFLLKAYCLYFIHAPVWDTNPYHTEETRQLLATLRHQPQNFVTLQDIRAWVKACLDIGLDPF